MQVANIQADLASLYMKLLAWTKGRVTYNAAEFARINNVKSSIEALNARYLAGKQYDSVNILFNQTARQFRDSFRTVDNQFTEKFLEVKEKEDFWRGIFKIAYILGSICLGLAYITNPKYPWRKFFAPKRV